MDWLMDFLNQTEALPVSIPVGLFFAWKLGFLDLRKNNP